jgi:cytochrome P450
MNTSTTSKQRPANGLPDGPKGWAGLKAILEFQRRGLVFLEEMARKYGPVAALHFLHIRVYLISNPDLIAEILVNQRDNFLKANNTERGQLFFGNPMQTNSGDQAKRQRQMMTSLFRQERIRLFGSKIAAQTSAMLDKWQAGETRNISQEISTLALNISIELHFGTPSEDAIKRIREPLLTALELVEDFLAPPLWMPTSRNSRFSASMAALDKEVYALINDFRANRNTDRVDLLAGLVGIKDESGQGFSDQQIRDELVSMLSAGYVPTALSVNQTLRLLADHPEVDAQAGQELKAVLGQGLATADNLAQLPYLNKVTKESLRLRPPAGVMLRIGTEDGWVDGWRIPAKTKVFLSQWVMQHLPEYFDQPDKFIPERWTPELTSSLPNFVYFPFGWGSRACMGQIWGMMEIQLILALILQRFRLVQPNAGKNGDVSFVLEARH